MRRSATVAATTPAPPPRRPALPHPLLSSLCCCRSLLPCALRPVAGSFVALADSDGRLCVAPLPASHAESRERRGGRKRRGSEFASPPCALPADASLLPRVVCLRFRIRVRPTAVTAAAAGTHSLPLLLPSPLHSSRLCSSFALVFSAAALSRGHSCSRLSPIGSPAAWPPTVPLHGASPLSHRLIDRAAVVRV